MATVTRTVTYNDQETALTGFLAWDDAARSFLAARTFLAEALRQRPAS